MYEDRAKKGAELLDRVRPGWAAEIATDELAMSSCDRCVLGQLYGDYFKGFREVLKPLPSTQLFSASRHGFTLQVSEQDEPDEAVMPRFAALAEAWRAEIRARVGREALIEA